MRANAALLALLLLCACGGVRKQLRDAEVLEQGGMLEKAYEAYAEVHHRRPNDAAALVGMRRVAQARYDRLAQQASERYLAGDRDGGDRLYAEAERILRLGEQERLELRADPLLEQRRTLARERWVTDTYQAALAAFQADRFEESRRLCGEVLREQRDHAEAQYLARMAELEPRYREARYAAQLGMWRTAYRTLERVTDKDPGYKDAWTELERYRREATWTLAYVPVYNGHLYQGTGIVTGAVPGSIETQLGASVKQAVLDLDDPLIVLVDRENTEQLLAEQQRSMEGTYDDAHVVEAGKLLGARYVLSVRILRFDDIFSKQAEVQAVLLDTETGAIRLSEVVRVNKEEIGRGAPRAQLIDRAAKRIAAQIGAFDPFKR
jgi:tetratricopeptide (TPR) repeat protein